MQLVRRVCNVSSSSMRERNNALQDRERTAQSAFVGVRRSGSVRRAAAISSSERPTRCAAWMKATRRSVGRAKRRCPPFVRAEEMSPRDS